MVQEKVYNGISGTILWVLKQKDPDGQGFLATDLASITRMTLRVDASKTIDSDTSPTAFDWQTANFTGELILTLGGESVTAGNYSNVRLTVYDPTNPLGLVWADDIYISFSD